MSASRRYEILLPLRFNSGKAVPEEVLGKVLSELEQRFGAVSWETQIIRGAWQHLGTPFRDDLTRIFIDVPDTPEHKNYFITFKENLKTQFQQLDIWLTSYSIEIL